MTAVQNLLPWMAQSALLATVGAVLPIVFRVHHPRAQIAYSHLVLIACLVIPWVEPWRHPRIVVPLAATMQAPPSPRAEVPVPAVRSAEPGDATATASAPGDSKPRSRSSPWNSHQFALWILLAGALLRLFWLLGGLWQTRRYRISAMPLYPIPESVRAASAVVHSNALFCVSREVPGPVTLGWLAPVVLLPESFLELNDEAQCGIACHELLHVRRGDWLITICEEVVAALLWFNPAAWALLAQTRLAREQLVDAEAVRLTGAPEPYIDALLAIARRNSSIELWPAPVFLRRRQLTYRMHSLLNEVSMSRLRLWCSYGSISALLAMAAWGTFVMFPLTGASVVVAAPAEPMQAPGAFAATEPHKPEAAPPSIPSKKPSTEPALLAFQEPVRMQLPRARFTERPARLASVPVTPDANEPVTGSIQNASDPADRGAALALLERARQHGISHRQGTPPFKLEATFSAAGAGEYSGNGQLVETWLAGSKWLWTATLGSYSVSRALGFGSASGEKYPGMLAMPVHMLRNAIFWAITPLPDWQVRTSAVQWKGRPATCLLMSGMVAPAEQTRLWEETEYCIDNASGVLAEMSIAPGNYTVFGYDRNLQFHGRSTPDRVTVYSNGKQILDAEINLVDAGPVDESQLRPTDQMRAAGPITTAGMWTRMSMEVPAASVFGLARPVIVHASVDGQGNVLEEELSATSDPAFTQQALDLVKKSNLGPNGLQRQVYVNVRFVPAAR